MAGPCLIFFSASHARGVPGDPPRMASAEKDEACGAGLATFAGFLRDLSSRLPGLGAIEGSPVSAIALSKMTWTQGSARTPIIVKPILSGFVKTCANPKNASGRAKWNGFVRWSVRARARTAVHRGVGSPLGPPGVLTPARRRASSVLRSPVCVRSRGLRRCALRSGVLRSSPLRSAAPRGAVRCTPASRTPPRRTPARPLSCRPLPPSRNPRPTALRPSGLRPCALSALPQTP